MGTVIDLQAEWDRIDREKSIDLKLSDGTIVHMLAPQLWPEPVLDALRDDLPHTDRNAFAALVFGEDNWAKIAADGKTYPFVDAILVKHLEASLGE